MVSNYDGPVLTVVNTGPFFWRTRSGRWICFGFFGTPSESVGHLPLPVPHPVPVTAGQDGGSLGLLPTWLKPIHLRTTFARLSQRAYSKVSTPSVDRTTKDSPMILVARLDVSPRYFHGAWSSHAQTLSHRPLSHRAGLLTRAVATTFPEHGPDRSCSVSDPQAVQAVVRPLAAWDCFGAG